MSSYRLALPALCLSLLLPLALPVQADDPAPAAEPAQPQPVVREPLPERSQEDAAALERQLPPHEQQQLQAGEVSFLALWKPANNSDPSGAVIIVPGAGETADWPIVVGPLRSKLPDARRTCKAKPVRHAPSNQRNCLHHKRQTVAVKTPAPQPNLLNKPPVSVPKTRHRT